MASSALIKQLINVENVRAFPNQFEISVSGGTDIEVIKNFSFYAKKITLGAFAIEQDRILSTQQTIIKKATIPDTVTITVKDIDTWDVLQYFYNWYTTYYYDPSARLFRSGVNGKRRDFSIYALRAPYNMTSNKTDVYAGDDITKQSYGMKIIVKDALLVGNISLPQFDYDSKDPVDHNFTIQSDDIKIEWTKPIAGSAPNKEIPSAAGGTRSGSARQRPNEAEIK